jgi:ferredoxin
MRTLQIHGLRRSVSGRLLLRGRRDVGDQSCEVCIDCGVCEPECPVDAIKADTTPEAAAWVPFNREKSREWPNIAEKGEPPADADKWIGVKKKFEAAFGVPPP